MSIRLIATELYSAQKKVSKLENELEAANINDKDQIREKLRVARSEKQQLRNILDGRKA
ncbi:MAG: hypothetical protein OEM02_17140 [Desulfobulbaceae bacterium]|nr:hypothetical protein [Desulfobulbaceae bacterium]